MARIRTIKPEFPQSESMGNVSRDARLTFLQLWTIADDEGRLRGNSRMLASLLFPYDDDAPALMEGWLVELEQQGCIQRYQVDRQTYLQICNWLIHQKIDKPSKSKLPAPQGESRTFANAREDSSEDQGSRTKDQGEEGNGSVPPAADGALDPEGSKPRKHHGSPADHEAARWIFGLVRVVNATAKDPNWDAWANDVRLMREQDDRTHHDICDLFRWANKDSFWSSNILSPGKLREKWDTLVMQRSRGNTQRPAGQPVDLDAARRAANDEARRRLGIGGNAMEVIDAQ